MDLFDWNYYIKINEDLKKNGIITKQQAHMHWLSYGKSEGRKHRYLKNQLEYYISNIQSLVDNSQISIMDAWDITVELLNDYDDKEYDNFDWKYYIETNKSLFKEEISNKKEALNHWYTIGRYNKEYKYIEDDYEIECVTKDNFDCGYYIKKNIDLLKNDMLTLNMLWEHWCNYGKYERRPYKCRFNKNITYETFDWEYYLNNSADLINKGFTQEGAWQHWIYYGRNENRKIRLYGEKEINEIKNEENKILENNIKDEIYEIYIKNNLYLNDFDKKSINEYLDDEIEITS